MADTNLKTILSDLYSITSGTWNKVSSLSSYQIKSFTSSDSISGNIDTNGSLKLDVNVSNFVANDITNALTIRTSSDGNPGLYVGLPVAQQNSFGLVKAGSGVSIQDGVLSVSLEGVGSADAVANNLTVFGTAWNGSKALTIKIADNDKYLTSSTSDNVITISSQNIGENTGTTNYLSGKTIVWDGLRALDTAIKSIADSIPEIPEIPEVPVYSIKKADTANTGYAATYNLTKDGVITGDSIDIIKDQFLKDAEIITATTDDVAKDSSIVEGGTYIKFTFELSTDNDVEGEEDSTKVIYLDASTLVNKDQLNQVVKAPDIWTYDTSSLKHDTLLFTEDGETAIYDYESKTIRDCSEETIKEITESTSIDLLPTVGAITGYIDTVKDSFGTANISGVLSIPDSYESDKNTLLFTADGETAIYDASTNTIIDCSEETVDEITSATSGTLIPNVTAIRSYFATFNDELDQLKIDFANLRAEIVGE